MTLPQGYTVSTHSYVNIAVNLDRHVQNSHCDLVGYDTL